MLSEETPIPEDLEQLTIPFYGLPDSAPFLAQLQSILNSFRDEQKLDKTLTIDVLLSVAYRLLTAVVLSSSPNRQPNLPTMMISLRYDRPTPHVTSGFWWRWW
jgi:hypothetical protein